MKRAYLLLIASFLFVFSYSQTTVSKKGIISYFDKTEKDIRSNVKEIYTETKSIMNLKDNDFTIISKVRDFIDSISFENTMIDNASNDSFFSSGKFKTDTDKIKMNFHGDFYDMFLYQANTTFSHNLKTMLPDSVTVLKEKSVLRIVSMSRTHPLIQMFIDANTMKLKSFQFKSYSGVYNVKIASYKTDYRYVSIPDSIEVFIDAERVMVSKTVNSKVVYK